MNRLDAFLPSAQAVLYLANVALAGLLACAAALLAALAWRRSLPTRYGLLLVGLVLALTSPGLVLLAGRAGIGRLEEALRQDRDADEVLHVLQDNQPRSVAVPRQPQVHTPTVRERLASEPDPLVESQAAPPVEPTAGTAALPWWCPPVHWLNRQLSDAREELCDNYVLGGQGDGASLAEVLVSLAERAVQPPPLPATVGMFEQRRARERCRALEQRVRRLLSPETDPMTHQNRWSLLLVALAGLGMTVAISLSQVRAAGEEAPGAKGAVKKSPASPAAEPHAGSNDSGQPANEKPREERGHSTFLHVNAVTKK